VLLLCRVSPQISGITRSSLASPVASCPPRVVCEPLHAPGLTEVEVTARILVVDDDVALSEMISIMLRGEGFDIHLAQDGPEAITSLQSSNPDLILLDVMLPGMDGMDVCQKIRELSGIPIIMLTAKSDSADVVRGLEAGADDYVVKPFNPKELVARIRTRLRPAQETGLTEIAIADVLIDVPSHEVRRGGERVNLTPLEFQLLLTLALRPQQVFTREELLEQVWGYRYKADTRLVNVHVQRLRSKIESDPDNPVIIETVRGVGYRSGKADSAEGQNQAE